MEYAVIAEVEGLVLPPTGPKGSPEQLRRDEVWELVWHLEAALRLVLALRLGRHSAGAEWIHLNERVKLEQWVSEIESAWQVVLSLVELAGCPHEAFDRGQRRLH